MRRAEAALSARLGRAVRLSVAVNRTAALSPLLAAGEELSELCFPHEALSLTHAGHIAVAARAEQVAGVGVDYEPWREVNLRTSRFFLRPVEQAAVSDSRDLLRLWTLKEALFKATPANAECWLTDFDLPDPQATAGRVVGPRGETLQYAGVDVGIGHLAVAVCEGRADADLR